MGDWAIVVHGTGAHHNKDYPTDADRMAQKFVDDLVIAGHQVNLATFTAGGRTVLDTIDNLKAKHLSGPGSDSFKDRIQEDSAGRVIALQRLGLHPSPRKEPLNQPLNDETKISY